LRTEARELGKCKLDLVGVEEVGWEKVGTEYQRITYFSMDKEMQIVSKGICFFVRKKIESAFRKVWFISDRLSYIILRSRWFSIVVLNEHSHMKIRGMM
jgi:hypothetical protein